MLEKLKEFMKLMSLRAVLETDEEDDWEDFDQKDNYISGAGNRSEAEDSPLISARWTLYLVIAGLLGVALIFYMVFSRRHTYTGYKVTDFYPAEDISGTRYQKLGSGYIKYGSDGVIYVNSRNEAQWSYAYTMETPELQICEGTLLLYEQQGYQVYLFTSEGMLGSFETDLPVLKAKVSSLGVAALMLREDNDCRIRLANYDGTLLAEIRTSLEDAGHPVDMAISRDAKNLMLSLVRIGSRNVDSAISFYDFSSASKSDESHLLSTIEYRDEIFPSVFYASDLPVAVGDKSFVCFKTGKKPSQDIRISFENEIVSVFNDDKNIGFVMPNESTDQRYLLKVYRYDGECVANKAFQNGYSEVTMDSGEILFHDAGHMMAFTTNGIMRLNSDYDKQIGEFVKIPGFRNYAVLTNSGIERIRAE